MRPRTPCSQEATSRQRRLETDTTVSHPQHVVLKPVRKQATQRGHRTSQVCQSSVACLIFAPPTPHRHKGNSNCTLTAPPACINKLARVLRNDPFLGPWTDRRSVNWQRHGVSGRIHDCRQSDDAASGFSGLAMIVLCRFGRELQRQLRQHDCALMTNRPMFFRS